MPWPAFSGKNAALPPDAAPACHFGRFFPGRAGILHAPERPGFALGSHAAATGGPAGRAVRHAGLGADPCAAPDAGGAPETGLEGLALGVGNRRADRGTADLLAPSASTATGRGGHSGAAAGPGGRRRAEGTSMDGGF